MTQDQGRPLRLRGFESEASWVNQRNNRYRHAVLEACLRAALSNVVIDLKFQRVQVGDAVTPCGSLQASHHVLIFLRDCLALPFLFLFFCDLVHDLVEVECHVVSPFRYSGFRPIYAFLDQLFSDGVGMSSTRYRELLLNEKANLLDVQLRKLVVDTNKSSGHLIRQELILLEGNVDSGCALATATFTQGDCFTTLILIFQGNRLFSDDKDLFVEHQTHHGLLRLKIRLDVILNLGLWLLPFVRVHKEDGRRQVSRQLQGEVNLVNAWHKTAVNDVKDAHLFPQDVFAVFELLVLLNTFSIRWLIDSFHFFTTLKLTLKMTTTIMMVPSSFIHDIVVPIIVLIHDIVVHTLVLVPDFGVHVIVPVVHVIMPFHNVIVHRVPTPLVIMIIKLTTHWPHNIASCPWFVLPLLPVACERALFAAFELQVNV